MIPLLLSVGLAHGGQTWAMNQRVASSASLPLFGRAVTFTDSLILLRTEPVEGGLQATQQVCSVRIDDPLPIAETTIPDAFVRALGVRSYPIAVGTGPGAAGALPTWSADPGAESVGYNSSLSGVLPREAEDPGVIDSDGDGQPGATVHVHVGLFGTVPVYVVQRAHSRWSGVQTADGDVVGHVEVVALEQRVIGAGNPLFHASPEIVWRPELSVFRASPVGAETTCDDLRSGAVPAPVLPSR